VPPPQRFAVLATLPDAGGLRRALAVERSGAARPVVLLFAAPAAADDPAALAALSRDAEAAARVHHPSVVPVAGLEAVGEALAVVELFRSGASLRDLLDGGGRLPPAVAARIGADVCAGLAAIHALDPGDGQPFAHGAVSPEWILVQDDGRAALAGLAATSAAGVPGTGPAADLRAVGAALHECLAGEPPARPAAPLVAPGVPAALATLIDRALGVAGTQPFASAAALGAALEEAPGPAAREAVAAYADAIVPRDEGVRGSLARLVSAALPPPIPPREDGEGLAEVTAELLSPDAAAPRGAGAPPAALEVEPTPVAIPAPRPVVPPREASPDDAGRSYPAASRDGGGRTHPAAASPDAVATFPRPEPPSPRSVAPLVAALLFGVVGFGAGLLLARATPSPPPSPPAPAAAEVATPPAKPTAPAPTPASATAAAAASAKPAERSPSRPKPAPRPSGAKRVAAVRPEGTGLLSVTAPLEAEVFLDGKPIGKGILRLEIPAGDHRVEVRLGDARVGERFSVARGETWTYVVNPE